VAKEFKFEIPTKGLDELFTTQDERNDSVNEKVQIIPFDLIDDFENHPFKVRMDDETLFLMQDELSWTMNF